MAAKRKTGPIFISYSHKDVDRILPYVQEMEKRSLKVWYDHHLYPGTEFNDEIALKILDCGLFILFLTQSSSDSKYVNKEFNYACSKEKLYIVVHLEKNVRMKPGMEMHTSDLQPITDYLQNILGTVDQIEEAYKKGIERSSKTAPGGTTKRSSELLKNCMDEFKHLISSQMNIQDIDQDIREEFFCPILPKEGSDKQKIVNLYDEIVNKDDQRHILLEAEGGLGKTYTFLHVMNRLLKKGRPCAYIPCQLFNRKEKAKDEIILDKLNLLYFHRKGLSSADLNDYFREQGCSSFVLFLDGFNEAVIKTDLAREIAPLSSNYPVMRIVVSSRSFDPVFTDYTKLTMRGLNEKTVSDILAGCGKNYNALDFSLRKLLLTPMFLRLYMGTDKSEKEIDTAAELMDREREKVLKPFRQTEDADLAVKEKCLNRIFPDFVRQEYLMSNRGMSFSGKLLEDFLKSRFSETGRAEELMQFLTNNSIILKAIGRNNQYIYRHEHYRDYWVAYSVIRELADCLEQPYGAEQAEAVIQIINQPYSEIVLQYIGELAQVHLDNSLLHQTIGTLRRTHVADDVLWNGSALAETTAKLLHIIIMLQEDDLIGMDLSELNLSVTQLNQARTCTKSRKADFRGSLITESTFVVSMHESAPRRVEILRLEEKNYLVTVSNHDLLISTLPDLESVWRYSHTDTEGKPVSTQVLISSVMLENCMIAVDSDHNTWKWTFAMRDGIPCISSMHRIAKKLQAVKVFPWSDQGGPLAGLQCTDGVIWLLALQPVHDSPEMQCTETHVPGIPPVENTLETLTPKTLTPSPDHTCFYWATGGGEGGIHVWRYDTDDRFSQEICHIPDKNLLPDYMICAGIEQASRKNTRLDFGASNQDGSVLILSAICEKHTRVYQIRPSLTGASNAEYTVLTWPDNELYLKNDYTKTERKYNRINASSFSGDKLVLAASDGSLYHFEWNQEKACYMPDSGKSSVSLTAPTFAIEDVLYVSSDAIAAVSVDRFVYLLEAKSLTPIKKLKGYNDGLRHLLLKNDNLILATSYDGNVLELSRTGDRFVCKDKITVGDWVWSLEIIHSSVCAAGYRSGLALVDIKTDSILWHKAGLPYKVEHLLYLPDRDQTLLCANKSGVQIYKVCDGAGGRMHLEEAGHLNLPENHACYWLVRKDDTLYASVNEGSDKHPRIACFDLTRPLEEQQPVMIETGVPFGRIRDIHCLGNYLIAPGPTTEDKVGKTSCVCFIRLRDGEDTTVDHLPDTYESFIAHSALQRIGESSSWRFAVIDSKTDGNLCQYILTEAKDGSLKTVKHSCCVFNTKLNEVAFDSRGDLLLACMDGHLYLKPWEDDVPRPLFRNKSYMLTFGADMSGLYEPVRPESPLGIILADFGNRLEMTQRGNTII